MYVAVIGGSGSGKGNCTNLYKDMVESNLAKHDAEEWEKVKATFGFSDALFSKLTQNARSHAFGLK